MTLSGGELIIPRGFSVVLLKNAKIRGFHTASTPMDFILDTALPWSLNMRI
ncbi:MAG: hypothetical protein R2861_05810 [Desulfobacterales bacterium]